MADIDADVIIVGSGISGALLAARLSNAGVKVAILEAGQEVARVEATQRFWDAAIKVPECPYPPTPQADHPITDKPDYWYRQSGRWALAPTPVWPYRGPLSTSGIENLRDGAF